ncbi:unnamed protein product [Clonostachys byssicola]|uniref:S-adenosylmethionine mitochondrial carrier protein n=1 Tax=Clonostachys byssicola TaxID=160290 RepID=A0A9N9UGE9_9HYPO|nr:unnamed protein product [Clonostachys byssicola]
MTDIYAAGALAALTIDALVYPLDTIKTRYQSQDYIKQDASHPLRKPLALRGLYQGIGSVVLATVPAAGLFFSTYENTKTLFSQAAPSAPTPLIHAAASATAEMASCLVIAPAEVIKQNAQMLNASNKPSSSSSTSIQAFRMLGKGKGSARRLFTGYTALVARNLPFTALQFPMFEHLRARLWASRGGDKQTSRKEQQLLETGMISGASAGSAGAVAAYITTPSDVVKTRMMLSAGERRGDDSLQGEKKAKLGAWAVTRLVYKERGIRGFFRGGLFRAGWTALGSGLYLGTYDVAKLWLNRRRVSKSDSAGL